METTKKPTFIEQVAAFIVDKRKIVFIVFIALCLFSAISREWVRVNDSLTDYLPESTETRQGLTLMDEQFVTYATAEIMLKNVSYERAEELYNEMLEIDGVKSIEFDDTEAHYKETNALYDVTFDGLNDDERCISALAEIEDRLSGYDLYTNSEVGNPLKQIINQELLIVDGIAVIVVILVLLLTSQTYGEIPVLLLTFGSAALLNMGTNFLMGEISFVTDSIAIVLQLALGIDYAIILCHRFSDEHKTLPAREAAIKALSKAIPEISASSLTTVAGLLALSFMQYRLGFDIGSVLIKAILLSLCSVFLLMPGLLVLFSPWIDKSHHRNFVPKISFLGKIAYRTRIVIPILFAGVLVAACIFSGRVHYVYDQYSVESIKKNDMQLAKIEIKNTFGTNNQMVVIVPAGDYQKEGEIIHEIEEISEVDSILGIANVEAKDGYALGDALAPRAFSELLGIDYEAARALYAAYAYEKEESAAYITDNDGYSVPLINIFTYLLDKKEEVHLTLDDDTQEELDDLKEQLDDAKLQLQSPDWSRIVINTTLPTEGEESFRVMDAIRGTMAKYYADFYVIGNTTSCKDLETSFLTDNRMISILSVVFVILVLIFTFKSVGLPVLLILVIQGSIWINFSIPYLQKNPVFFLTYLIISSIQMGANIDYAIVISSHYMELKEEMSLQEAIIETLNQAFPTIITSGTMLASAGLVIGLITSNETVSAIGTYLCVGTLVSIFLVMCVLPQILLLGDIVISKTAFKTNLTPEKKHAEGKIRLDGKVKGELNGYIDAEVHGYFTGTIDAVMALTGKNEKPAGEEDIQPIEEGVKKE